MDIAANENTDERELPTQSPEEQYEGRRRDSTFPAFSVAHRGRDRWLSLTARAFLVSPGINDRLTKHAKARKRYLGADLLWGAVVILLMMIIMDFGPALWV